MLERSLQAPSHESRGYSHHEELAWDAKLISPWTALMNLHNSFKSACNLMHQILSLPFPVSLSAYPFRPFILVINLSNQLQTSVLVEILAEGGEKSENGIILQFQGPNKCMWRYFCLPVFIILAIHKPSWVNVGNLGYLPIFI